MINTDVFSLKSFPAPEKIKSLSPSGISYIRYQEELYLVLKFENSIKMTLMYFHPMTLKHFDEEIKPTEIPRLLSEKEVDYIQMTLGKIDFRVVANCFFEQCYPHEAASLSLGVVPNKVVYYSNEEKCLKFKDREVRDRTMMLCDHHDLWNKEIDNYRLPLCDHIEKLLTHSSFDIDKILLNLIEENIFLKDKEHELLNKHIRLANQLRLYRTQNDASEIGKKGNKERNEPHEKARMIAINYCRDLLQDEKNNHLKSHQILKIVGKYLTIDKKIFNPYKKRQGKKQSYDLKTIKVWINHLIPNNRKTIGSPKKEKSYGVYTVPNN